MPKHISIETKEAIVNDYRKKPVAIGAIAEKYGLCQPTVVKILSQYHVKLWPKRLLFSPDLKENYFKEIDSQDKAYYLGLITTDGCVYRKNQDFAFLAIELQKEDGYILEGFMKEMRCNRKLVYSKRSNTLTATVTSVDVVHDLERYHVYPQSSLTQRFWAEVPDSYLASYLRGLVDGDGSFGLYARPERPLSRRKQFCMCSGSEVFLEGFIDKLVEALGVMRPRINSDPSCNAYDTRWTRKDDLEAIISFLYSASGPYFVRKKEVAERILADIRQHRDNGRLTAS